MELFIFIYILLTSCLITIEINLNGRIIPDPDTYKYHYKPNGNEIIQREYVLMETNSRIALLCPKDYYIESIAQLLIVNENSTSALKNKHWAKDPQVAKNENKGYDAACPTLQKCISYQACLFTFSIEFCKQDPAPGIRKFLNINITCHPSSYYSHRHVAFISYESRNEVINNDYSNIEIDTFSNSRDTLFEVDCPSLNEALKLKYGGYCTLEPPSSNVISEQLWKVLGRTKSAYCQEQIHQVYCAYQYHRRGACIPPFYLKHERFGKVTFNEKSLPENAMWPDSSQLKKLLTDESRSLIPARLAFLILIHKDVDTVIQLLHLIYRPYFFYVIHVDETASHIRSDLIEKVLQVFPSSLNIYILPEERSFRTSWASYEIVRAELECFEELLRKGLWDFAINLSGADLPLRDVDDLAAALAEYRGNTLFAHALPRNKKHDSQHYKEALFACDGYVYSVTSTDGQPLFDEFQVYSSPQWAVFHRDFVEYVVKEEKRTMVFNKYQFFLQTAVVPDESYLITALMNSPLGHTLRRTYIHFSKTFANKDKYNLCRHENQDADFCGQGPLAFEMKDMEEISYSVSHRAFFARKFHSDVNHPTRNEMMTLIQGGYYSSIARFLPSSVIKKLANQAMVKLKSDNVMLRDYQFLDVVRVRIFPRLYPENPCCHIPFQKGFRSTVDYSYWIDFEMESSRGQIRRARALIKPKFGGSYCFGEGHLRMAFVTTWTRTQTDGSKTGLDYSIPLPYFPSNSKHIWILLVFHGNTPNPKCLAKNHGPSLMFEDLDLHKIRASPLNMVIQFVDTEGHVFCKQFHTIQWNNMTVIPKNEEELSPSDISVHSVKLECEDLSPGKWIIEVFKDEEVTPVIYNIPLYLVDLQELMESSCQPSCPWESEEELWKIDAVSILPFPDFYQETSWHDMIPIKVPSDNCQKSMQDRKLLCVGEWLTCSGGIITMAMCAFFFYNWILKPFIQKTVKQPLRYITYNVLFIVCIFLLQELLFVHYCS